MVCIVSQMFICLVVHVVEMPMKESVDGDGFDRSHYIDVISVGTIPEVCHFVGVIIAKKKRASLFFIKYVKIQ